MSAERGRPGRPCDVPVGRVVRAARAWLGAAAPPRAGCCASRPCWWSPRSCSACWACSAAWPGRTPCTTPAPGSPRSPPVPPTSTSRSPTPTRWPPPATSPAASSPPPCGPATTTTSNARAGGSPTAAGLLPPGDPAIAAISTVGEQLPVYTGLVENARALNRLGLPLGQSYLASASKLMQTTILPAVEQVRTRRVRRARRRLPAGRRDPVRGAGHRPRRARRDGRSRAARAAAHQPGAQRRPDWWPGSRCSSSWRGGRSRRSPPTRASAVRTGPQRRRSGTRRRPHRRAAGAQQREPRAGRPQQRRRLLRRGLHRPAATTCVNDGGLLADGRARRSGARRPGRPPCARAATAWGDAHRDVRRLDDGGQYPQAVASVVGHGPGTSGGAFDALDAALAATIGEERAAFAVDVEAAEGALVALPWISAALALVAAGAVIVGIGRRVGEYR